MAFLTDSALSKMRELAEELLPGTCTIQTATYGRDAIGGSTISWANAATAVPCEISASTDSRNSISGNEFTPVTGWIIDLPYDQTITAGQRVLYGSDTFEVMTVDDDTDYRVLRTAYARRVDG